MKNNFEIVENINMSNIIVLALTYNYFETGKLILDLDKAMNFYEKINHHLSKKNLEISGDIDDDYNILYEMDIEKNKCKLEDWQFSTYGIFMSYAKDIPEEIIKISLQQDVLDTIDVERKNIKTQIEYKRISETKEISTLNMENAQRIARKYLTQDGCQNISIGYGIPGQKDDKYYNVPVTYDKPTIQIDYESSEKNLLKRRSEQKNNN